jgi:L-alanine-DL-glutamate epimerase-like enolase superfamily enzyme
MSKVEQITCHRVSVPLHTPFVTALRRTTTTDSLLVEVTDSDGVTGWGEAPQVWQVTGESVAGAEACVDGPLRAAILGGQSDDLVELTRRAARAVARNHGAKAAVDVALHDLVARRRGVSLPVLLGSSTHRVATDVTLSAGSPAELAEVATARVKDGFGVLKMKVGTDAAADVERVTVPPSDPTSRSASTRTRAGHPARRSGSSVRSRTPAPTSSSSSSRCAPRTSTVSPG